MRFIFVPILPVLVLLQALTIHSAYVVKTCGSLPSARYAAQLVYDGDDSIYFFGGIYYNTNDIYCISDIAKYKVSTQTTQTITKFPYPLASGSASDDGLGNIFYFGGSKSSSLDNSMQTAIFKFKDDQPPVVVKHLQNKLAESTAVRGENGTIYIGGGRKRIANELEYSGDIYEYSSIDNTIKLIAQLPTEFVVSEISYYESTLYIFGGLQYFSEGFPDRTIYTLDLKSMLLKKLDSVTSNYFIQASAKSGKHKTTLLYQGRGGFAFSNYHHDVKKNEDLNVDISTVSVYEAQSTFVSKNNKFYFAGSIHYMDAQSSTPIYCLELNVTAVNCPVDGIHFLPDPEDCAKYYICANGEPFHEQCAEGLLFDPDIGKCNTADEVECDTPSKCPDEYGVSYLPVVGDSSKYILCISGEGTEQECAIGTKFSSETLKCVVDSEDTRPYTN